MPDCLIGVGSNVGDRAATLDAALDRLRQVPAIEVTAVSRWHETPPIGGPAGQGAFLNGAALLRTSLSPDLLWQTLAEVETSLGRERHVRWAERTLDMDLLLYGGLTFSTPRLTVPHPRMAARRFVLDPALDIAADMIHPRWGLSLRALHDRLQQGPAFLTVCSADADAARTATQSIAEQSGAVLLTLPPRGPSGRSCEAAIEFLDNALATFQATRSPGGNPVVADTNILWLARELQQPLPASQQARFGQHARPMIDQAPRPGFTLLIDPELSSDRMVHPPAWLGPALVVPGQDLARVVEEGVAALAAMQ